MNGCKHKIKDNSETLLELEELDQERMNFHDDSIEKKNERLSISAYDNVGTRLSFTSHDNIKSWKNSIIKDDLFMDEAQLDTEFKKIIKTPKFIFIIICCSLIFACPITNAINYKSIGLIDFDDRILTNFSMFFCFTTVFTRIMCGIIIDKFGLTKALKGYCICFMVTTVVFWMGKDNLIIFMSCYVIFFAGIAYFTTLYPITVVWVYGIQLGGK